MTVGTQQLLASVVSKPKLSSVDARFMGVIWDCFTTWLAEQLHAKLPVRCLGLGEFTLRRDTIGPMEFFNPMFVLSEGFAHRFQLHDRRPKPAALGSASAARATDVDIAKVTQMVTEKLGEVVLRETVEHALRDAIERIGDFCSDERAHGIVTIDLLLGKLVCENRSVELHFLSQDERARALDAKKKANAKASARTVNWGGAGGAGDELGIIGAGARPGTALSDAGTRASSLAGRPASSGQGAALPDPPLQRPRRTQVKKVAALDPRDMLLSHATQIARKAEAVRDEHKSEAEQFSSDMSRLRGEMVLELEERVHRKSHMRDVALIHQVQAHEKALRDRDARQLLGTDHFPFRTEEQAKAQVKESNAVLKQNLDGQMAELSMARRILAKGAYSASGTPDVFATSLSMGHSEQPPPSASSDRPQLAMQVAIDDAYVRYSRFLEGRAGAEERARSYADEQSLLAEQAELIRREEGRRRAADMADYLKRQIAQKELRERESLIEKRAYKPPQHLAALPAPKPRDLHFLAESRLKLRHTLDQQVEAKQRARAEQEGEEVAAQAEMLQLVSSELRETRTRDLQRKAEEQVVLREAWGRQTAFKNLEKIVAASDL